MLGVPWTPGCYELTPAQKYFYFSKVLADGSIGFNIYLSNKATAPSLAEIPCH